MTDRIQLVKTAFVIYNHVDLTAAKQFLLDFGLTVALERPGKEIFFQGFGTEPYIYVARQADQSSFGGAAYLVESAAELERAHRQFGGSEIVQLDGHPGGGQYVTLTDPAGHPVHLVYGWEEKEKNPDPDPVEQKRETDDPNLQKLVVNYADDKPRKGKFHRFQRGRPAPVHRWGHYGVIYPEGQYDAMYNWYTTTLSLAPSDILHKDEKPVVCFFHIDRGLEFTDHHCFFFKPVKPGEKSGVAHSAFEVHDFDVQQLGHDYLAQKGYELCWGVGRVSGHLLP
jgi:hypothetical protein